MKLSKYLTTLGLMIGLMSANMIEIPFINIKNNATAITIPNFSPSANFRNGTLTVEIPAPLIQAGLSEVLRANEGEIKSTEFQKVKLSNMRATLTNGGIRVLGDWTFSVRERIAKNPFTGKWNHTPWVTEKGTFHQDFNLSVVNGQLRASTNGRPNVSSSAWYGVIIDEIIHHLDVRNNVKNQLDAQLSSFNGLNLQGMLVQYGASTATSQLGVDQNQVSSFINSNVGGIDGNFNGIRLAISLSIPSLQSPQDRLRSGFYSRVGMNPPGIIYLWPSPWDGGKTDVWCDVPNHSMYTRHINKIGSAIEVSNLDSIKNSARYWSKPCTDDVFEHSRVQH